MSKPEDKMPEGDTEKEKNRLVSDVDCVGDVEDAVVGAADFISERSSAVVDAEENARPFKLDDYGIAGKNLDGFFRNEAISHAEATRAIQEIFPCLTDGAFDVRSFIINIPHQALFSTSHVPGEGSIVKAEMMEAMRTEVLGTWRAEGRAFLRTPAFGRTGFRVKTALKCPRFVGDDHDLTSLGVSKDDRGDPVQALRYRVLFLKASHEAFEADDGHRTAYMAAQLSALIGKNVGARRSIPLSHEQRVFDVPSLAMFRKGKDTQNAKVFIKAVLSLILPDKADYDRGSDMSLFDEEGNLTGDIVQEDFVLVDLMGLAKKMEIYDDFKEIFAAIFKLRHLSFVQKFHLGKGRGRRSLADNLAMMKEYSGSPAKVFSLGHGDGVLEKELLKDEKDPMVSEVTGVDLHTKSDLDLVEETNVGKAGRFVKVARGRDDDKKRIDRVFAQFDGEADIGVAGDCLHETENPFAYMLKLYEKIKPGGFLYVTDPIHCQATDKVTSVTLNHFDNTRHTSSMLSLEQYFEIIGYLTMKGAKVYDISITPGIYAGYNDTLWRITFSIRKPDMEDADTAKRYNAPYKLPVENVDWDLEISSDEDVFNVWPLSCIEVRDRAKVLEVIENNLGCKVMDFGKTSAGDLFRDEVQSSQKCVKFGDVKELIIKGLLVGGAVSEDRVKHFVHSNSPYGSILPRLFANLRSSPMNEEFVDRELESSNHYAGEVLAIVSLLKTECGIDISEKVRQASGWRDVEFNS